MLKRNKNLFCNVGNLDVLKSAAHASEDLETMIKSTANKSNIQFIRGFRVLMNGMSERLSYKFQQEEQ